MDKARQIFLAFMTLLALHSLQGVPVLAAEPHLHSEAGLDVAVFTGPAGDARLLSEVAKFARRHGFKRESLSLPGSPDYHKGSSPVIMVSNTHDGSVTVALVKDSRDTNTYAGLAQDLRDRMIPLGFQAVTRPPVIVLDETD